jgi:uncharacterized protein YjbJ (UPF0337 family)
LARKVWHRPEPTRQWRVLSRTAQATLAITTREEGVMGSTTDKIKGYANEAAGKAKQAVGKAIGNDRLRAKCAAQEIKGDAQKAVGKAKGAIKDAADKVADQAHEKL